MAGIGAVSTGGWLAASSIMPDPPPDYPVIERSSWGKNASQVVERLDQKEPNLLKRIATFVRRFGFPDHDVRKKIRDDEMFRAHFAIEPRRQGIHEKAAAGWLRTLEGVTDFQVLPKSGRNAVYITGDGEVRWGMKSRPSKSLDFRWRSGTSVCYAAHKYTLEGGGNQDSQFLEMRSLLESFQKALASPTVVLFVIVDGPYFTDARIQDLRRFVRTSPPYSYATPITEVPALLAGLEESRP